MKTNRLLLLLYLLLPVPTLAGEAIELEADRVEIDEKKGVGRYIGNVHMVQGALSIQADTMTVYRQGKQLQKIIFTGNPVRFAQQPGEDRKEIRGQSGSIEYSSSDKMLVLQGEAEVWQEQDHFSGNIIRYDIENKQILASKGEAEGGRVRVTINPDEPAEKQPPATPETGAQ